MEGWRPRPAPLEGWRPRPVPRLSFGVSGSRPLPPRISDVTQDTPDCRFPNPGCDKNLYFGIPPCPEGPSRTRGSASYGMSNGKTCDPDTMLRGSVAQQTSEMMALPLLLLVMSRRGSDHQNRMLLLMALLMSTSYLKLSSFAIVPLIGIAFLGVQLFIELVPLLFGRPLHMTTLDDESGWVNWHSVGRASGALTIVGLVLFLLLRAAGWLTSPEWAQWVVLGVTLGFALLWLLAGWLEWRYTLHPRGGFHIKPSCSDARKRVDKLRLAVTAAPAPPGREKADD